MNFFFTFPFKTITKTLCSIQYTGAGESMVFIAMPRLEQGVPMTVGYVTELLSKEGNPLIAPYPDWEWNRLGDCDSITSTYRVQVLYTLKRKTHN